MHAVVTSFGSDGDFNPLLAVARALVHRGVDVSFVANPFYEQRVARTGSRFVAAGACRDIFAIIRDNPRYLRRATGGFAIWKDLVVPSIRETYPVVQKTIREVGAATVVSHVLSFGGIWAAARAGVRNVVVTTTPAAWLSRHQPTVFANWRAPHLVQAALTLALRGIGDRILRRALRPLATDLGAAGGADVVPIPDLNLGAWPEWFRPPAPDDPPHTQTCGFFFDPIERLPPLADEIASFLAAGEPPVVAGFGSAARLHGAQRYHLVAAACERLGRRCLLIGATPDQVPPRSTLLAVEAAPYARIFPAASAVVHHGGLGTCAEALRAGAPSLVTPFAFDQFDTAARLEATNLGRWLRPADDVSAMASTLDMILRDAAMTGSARAAAAQIAAAPDGAERAAAWIESV